ncbi:hypothetical protein Nepgr_018667 [Nepenthes gracilis]|uniref:Uncharacterized protein n=1 Tax=Nepenthes gracilis TaxID=150966 RepID=A0AAD3SU10_NEPGR|nr:hypothetical protein Nepgr_018667 [Nepenthes gracilis]
MSKGAATTQSTISSYLRRRLAPRRLLVQSLPPPLTPAANDGAATFLLVIVAIYRQPSRKEDRSIESHNAPLKVFFISRFGSLLGEISSVFSTCNFLI